ncbi:MAG: zinc metallopeptidase [Oscillospiraceae bacterium]|jgi:Zn-dependent membrane protease YugP|nr:zinc metallopeptidase [Oscillospiraceae bacterium]
MNIWYILCIAAIIVSVFASVSVKATFGKYNGIRTRGGRSAAEIAREILDDNGLYHVKIVECPGDLSDHYDPRNQTVALSQTVHNNDTIGAVSVAAHEVGHAIQHARNYAPVKIRTAIFPLVSICSRFWYVVLLAGILLEMFQLVQAAIILFSVAVFFQFITLPVEFDASNRAMATIADKGYLNGDEIAGARKTLSAAAFTYIAALLVSLTQLLRLLASARR